MGGSSHATPTRRRPAASADQPVAPPGIGGDAGRRPRRLASGASPKADAPAGRLRGSRQPPPRIVTMPLTVFAAEAGDEEAARLGAALGAAGVSAELSSTPEPVRGAPPPGGLGPGVKVLSVFVGSRVDGDLLDACPDLELVATRSTGFDHVDLAACKA